MSLGFSPLSSTALGSPPDSAVTIVVDGLAQLNLSATGYGWMGVALVGEAALTPRATAAVATRVDAIFDSVVQIVSVAVAAVGRAGYAMPSFAVRGRGDGFHAPNAHGNLLLPPSTLGIAHFPPLGHGTAAIETRGYGLGFTGTRAAGGVKISVPAKAVTYVGRCAFAAGVIRVSTAALCSHGVGGSGFAKAPLAGQGAGRVVGVTHGCGTAGIRVVGVGYGYTPPPVRHPSLYVRTRSQTISVRVL